MSRYSHISYSQIARHREPLGTVRTASPARLCGALLRSAADRLRSLRRIDIEIVDDVRDGPLEPRAERRAAESSAMNSPSAARSLWTSSSMTSRRVLWTRQAREDLCEIKRFIARQAPRTALAFIRKVKASVERLRDFPESGHVVAELGDPLVREVIRGNYRLICRVDQTRVVVLTVFHRRSLSRGRSARRTRSGSHGASCVPARLRCRCRKNMRCRDKLRGDRGLRRGVPVRARAAGGAVVDRCSIASTARTVEVAAHYSQIG